MTQKAGMDKAELKYRVKYRELLKETAKWRNLAVEAAEHACFNCEEYAGKRNCENCRMRLIKEEAGHK